MLATSPFADVIKPWCGCIVAAPPEAVCEIPELRSSHGKAFWLPTGEQKHIYHVGAPVHRWDGSAWQDVDLNLRGDGTVTAAPYSFAASERGVGFAMDGESLSLVALDDKPYEPRWHNQEIEGNLLTYRDVADGLDIVFECRRGKVRTHRILYGPHAPHRFTWRFRGDKAKLTETMAGRDAGGADLLLPPITTSVQPDGSLEVVESFGGRAIYRPDPATRRKKSRPAEYPVWIDPDVSVHIAATVDDGYESPSAIAYSNAVLYFGASPSYFHRPFFRFRNVSVAQGATLAAASGALLKFNVTGKFLAYNGGTFYGSAEDSAGIVTTATRPATRTKTSHSCAFATPGSAGIKSLDVTGIVQEIVNRSGWASGNNLLIFAGAINSTSTAYSKLEDYSAAGTNEAVLEITLAAGASGGLFRPASLSGLGAGGPFFGNPLN